MWSLLVAIISPFFERFFGINQRDKQDFIEAFISQLAVKAIDNSILLGLA